MVSSSSIDFYTDFFSSFCCFCGVLLFWSLFTGDFVYSTASVVASLRFSLLLFFDYSTFLSTLSFSIDSSTGVLFLLAETLPSTFSYNVSYGSSTFYNPSFPQFPKLSIVYFPVFEDDLAFYVFFYYEHGFILIVSLSGKILIAQFKYTIIFIY